MGCGHMFRMVVMVMVMVMVINKILHSSVCQAVLFWVNEMRRDVM